jgi:hypothetical protein
MPNIRVRAAIERISNDINRVGHHIVQHSGIDPKDARFIDNVATDIAVTAAQIAELARQAQGVREKSGSLVRKTRKAMGFTIP